MMPDMEMGPTKADLFSLSPEELADLLEGSGRAKQVWVLLRQGKDPIGSDGLGKKARALLVERCRLEIPKVRLRQKGVCGTSKFLLELSDGLLIESVFIPGPARNTLCVSTQVGCARACAFCATGTMGLLRQLSAGEIVAQVHWVERELADQGQGPVSNLVFMGMGEPLDNFEAVEKSISILSHPLTYGMASRRMTLSTIGPSPEAIARCAGLPINLAWSLHAADDTLRAQLIPKLRYSNIELRDAFAKVLAGRRSSLFVEMALMDGVNDGLEHADQLMALFSDMRDQVRTNLLPMNPGPGDFQPSPAGRVEAFRKHLQDHGYFCETRKARGQDIQAACGQLAVTEIDAGRS